MDSKSEDLVRNYRAVASGCLRLLSIEALKGQLGSKWQAKLEQMLFVVESIIRRHLQRGQTFYQANDSTYVIVFDTGDEQRAEFVCRAISREIIGRLLGSAEVATEDPAIEMRIASVPADQVQGGRLPADALDRHFAAAAPQVISSRESEPGMPQSGPIPNPLAPDAPARGGAAQKSGDWQVLLLEQLRQIEAGLPGVEGAAPAAPAAEGSDAWRFDFHYLPFWSAASNAFLCHRLESRLRLGDQTTISGDGLARRVDDAEVIRAFDRAILTRALADIRKALERDRKYVAIVPMHAESLMAEKDRRWLLTALERQPEPLPRLVVLELINSQALRAVDLTRHIWSLHKSCRRIVLRQALNHLPWIQSQHLPAQAIGVSAVVPPGGMAEREVIGRMDAFMESARQRGFESYVFGLKTRSLAFAAIGAGFNHISGPAIAPRSREIGRVTSAAMDTLFGGPKPS